MDMKALVQECVAMVTNKRWFLEARSAIKLIAGRLEKDRERILSYLFPWQPIIAMKKDDL